MLLLMLSTNKLKFLLLLVVAAAPPHPGLAVCLLNKLFNKIFISYIETDSIHQKNNVVSGDEKSYFKSTSSFDPPTSALLPSWRIKGELEGPPTESSWKGGLGGPPTKPSWEGGRGEILRLFLQHSSPADHLGTTRSWAFSHFQSVEQSSLRRDIQLCRRLQACLPPQAFSGFLGRVHLNAEASISPPTSC